MQLRPCAEPVNEHRVKMANLPTSIIRPLLCAMAVGCMITASGQCTNASAYGSAAAPTSTTPVTISTCSFQSEYSTITGIVAGTSYTVTSDCGGYITVRRVTYNGTFVANGNSPLTFTAPTAGTYYLHWNTNAACGTASNCCTTTIACTSCPPPPGQCTAVSIPSLPVTGQAVICHASDLLTSTNVGICGSGSTLYLGGNEALYSVTPTTTDNYVINYAGQSYSSIWVYSGACPAAGGMCQGSVSGTGTAQSLVVTMTAGVQYWIIFDTWPTPQSPCPGTFSITVSSVPPPVTASDCILAVPVCTNIDFQIDPNGFGNTNEIPPLGSYGNPDYGIFSFTPPYYNPWGTYNEGCLRNEELNSTWMVVNVLTGGSLAFTFGGLGTQTGFYDWAMYPYDASACGAVASNALAPVRCNWNGVSFGGTGLATTPPAGGDPSNFEPPLNVGANTQWLICFSNWSSVTTTVPLQFGGTAGVSCSPLPVELLSFEAKAIDRDVALEWVTASELNSSHFDVERSGDTGTWEKVDVVDAAGNSQMPIRYATTDHAPLPGLSYYRLRTVDLDGSFKFSPVVPVQLIQDALLCYPNPSNGAFMVSSVPDGAVIDVRDALGRLVAVDVLPGATGNTQVKLQSPTPGVYSVRVSYNAVVVTGKVLIAEQ